MVFFKKIILLALVVFTISCNFTENINVNEDGTGNFSVEIDGSGLMAMAGEKIGENLVDSKNKKSIDSTFSFKKILKQKKDSIAKLPIEEQEALKKMENFVMHMKMDPEKKELLFSMKTPFKNVSELHDMMSEMNTLKQLKGKSDKVEIPNPIGDGLKNNAKLNFSYDGNSFVRMVHIDKEALHKIKNDTLSITKMMFASSHYTLKYHFPKAVKSVSNPDALYSADRKTITIQYPFTDYMNNPEKMNLTIDFE
ncbi:hypothetical protein [Flavobacterium sp.]|uniref:hypothetical protein n=1 Tax=Flavobacterium sp. TaxID=239 RepID=UPI003C3D0A88